MAHETFEGSELKPGGEMHRAKSEGFDPRNQHPDYKANMKAWQATRDFYLGAEGLEPNAQMYVPKRAMGEADEHYHERINLLHFPGLLGALVDGLVGLWARKTPEEDTWGEMGGEGDDGEPMPDSLAAKIVKDADRGGTSWDNHRRARATWMFVYRKAYIYVDTNKPLVQTEDGEQAELTREQAQAMGVRPFVNIVSPLDVLDWIEDDGKKIEVVIREGVDERTSLDDGEGEDSVRYLRLMLTGWQRWEVRGEKEQAKVDMVDSGSYRYVDRDGNRRLPLVEAELPMPRYGAYNLALICRGILNNDSYLDTLGRAGVLGQYLAIQGDSQEIKDNISEGDKVLPYPPNANVPQFVAYEMGAAAPVRERIKELTERFWQTAMWEFSDRPQQKTATEMEQQWASGIGSTLTLLAQSMQEAENEEKWLLWQAVNRVPESQRPNVEQAGMTKFATDYKVEDIVEELKRLKELVFGMAADIPMTARLKAAVATYLLRRLDDQSGLLSAVEEEVDVEQEVEAAVAEGELEAARMRGLAEEAATQPGFPEEEEEAPDEAA